MTKTDLYAILVILILIVLTVIVATGQKKIAQSVNDINIIVEYED